MSKKKGCVVKIKVVIAMKGSNVWGWAKRKGKKVFIYDCVTGEHPYTMSNITKAKEKMSYAGCDKFIVTMVDIKEGV